MASDVGSELVGVTTALLSTLKASPHVGVEEAGGMRLSVDDVGAAGSTANGSPHDDVCAEEMPRRESRVVFRREDFRILDRAVRYVCFVAFESLVLGPCDGSYFNMIMETSVNTLKMSNSQRRNFKLLAWLLFTWMSRTLRPFQYSGSSLSTRAITLLRT